MCDSHRTNTFPRGEGGRAKRGRKRNGDILASVGSIEKMLKCLRSRLLTLCNSILYVSPFLFSHKFGSEEPNL